MVNPYFVCLTFTFIHIVISYACQILLKRKITRWQNKSREKKLLASGLQGLNGLPLSPYFPPQGGIQRGRGDIGG
jgi:hypothetical protein